MSNHPTIAIITGGSRVLGRNTVISLARRSVRSVFTYHSNRAEADDTVAAVREAGADAVALQLDTGAIASFDPFVEQLRSALTSLGAERFDYLVNNAGTALCKNIDQTTEEELDAIYNVHFKGVLLLTQKLLPLINDGGRIVNISSGLTRMTFAGSSAYASMKGAVEVLTRYLAKELGPRRIAVNTVAPEAIDTDFGGGFVRDNPELNKFVVNMTALCRVGVPDDIGPMIAALLCDDNRWINAQRIEVSGGGGPLSPRAFRPVRVSPTLQAHRIRVVRTQRGNIRVISGFFEPAKHLRRFRTRLPLKLLERNLCVGRTERLRRLIDKQLVARDIHRLPLPLAGMLQGQCHPTGNVVHRDLLQNRFLLQRQPQHAVSHPRAHAQPVLHEKHRPQDRVMHSGRAQVFLDPELALEMRDARLPVRAADRTVNEMVHFRSVRRVDHPDPVLHFRLYSRCKWRLHGEHPIHILQRAQQTLFIVEISARHLHAGVVPKMARRCRVRVPRQRAHRKSFRMQVPDHGPSLRPRSARHQDQLLLVRLFRHTRSAYAFGMRVQPERFTPSMNSDPGRLSTRSTSGQRPSLYPRFAISPKPLAVKSNASDFSL